MDKENISFGLRWVFAKAGGVSSWQLEVAENDDLSAPALTWLFAIIHFANLNAI